MRRVVLACILASALFGIVLAVPASAVPTCTFDAGAGTVELAVGNGESATIGRTGDAITLNGGACDAATVQNTDTITVTSTGTPTEVALDLSGGGFAPGATAETDGGASEIEISVSFPAGSPTLRVVGGSQGENVVVGSGGVNLNAAEAVGDVDVTITGAAAIVVEGGDGDDVLSAAGGSGTGSATTGVSLRGGAGGDTLLAGVGPNTLNGGDGIDRVDYSAAAQLLPADLSSGSVEHAGGAVDSITGIENLTGSPGDDTIVGDGTDNNLRGGAGNDTIDGAGGSDVLAGGEGDDTVEFRTASAGVTVDLAAGTATGAGNDVLADFENVTGSDLPDTIDGNGAANVLRGLFGEDELRGRGGDDVVRGGRGGDRLFGGNGDDLLRAGHGKDLLDGGPGNDVCRGARDPDVFVFCENYPTRE